MRPDKDNILEMCYEICDSNNHSDEAKVARLLTQYIEAMYRIDQDLSGIEFMGQHPFAGYVDLIEESFKLAE